MSKRKLPEAFSDVCADTSTTEWALYAGKYIGLTIPNKPTSYSRAQVERKILNAINNINRNTGKMDARDVKILRNIKGIALSSTIGRSGIDVRTGIFFIKIEEVMEESFRFLSDNIAHDSFHIFQYRRGGVAAIKSTAAEVEAIDFQLKLAFALGVSKSDQRFLRRYQSDAAAIDKRRLQKMW